MSRDKTHLGSFFQNIFSYHLTSVCNYDIIYWSYDVTYNFIRRDIEVVITGLTRNVNDLVTRECAKARVFVDYLANAPFFLNFGCEHFSTGLAFALQNSNTTEYGDVSKWS